MTTLHITNAYYPDAGGLRSFYDALLEAGNREGRRVVVVLPGRQTETSDVGDYGRIHFIRAPRPLLNRPGRVLLPHRFLPGLSGPLMRILEREQPSIVEICGRYSLPYLAAVLRKGWYPRVTRPTLVALSCDRFDTSMASSARRALTQWYIRNVYGPLFDAHIAISEYTANELRTALPDRPPGFVRVSPLGVDADRYAATPRSASMRSRLLRRAGGDGNSVLLFHAGRLARETNIGLLVDMLRELVQIGNADYRLLIAGEGPLAGWVRHQATGAIAGRIHCCGVLDGESLASCYANCDVFLTPNPCEAFAASLLAAMASGVPVVAPDRGGVLEYATDRDAWLAAPDARSFASAVTAARAGDPQRQQRAVRVAHRFRWSRVTTDYFALYDELQGRPWSSRISA
jgi:glycosyltransferase involved in cell wall biosynthesis